MHLRFLKIFCDIVDMRSFSRAAKANNVSQSNASQIVHQLEGRMGVQLIDRSTRPFVVTPEGKRFHEGARVIVQRYDDLEREVRSLHEAVAARLTVASIYSVGLAHMSGCLREFLAAHPKADVRLEYLHPHRVYETVDNGQADIGLVSYPEESPSLATIPWRTEPMVLVCHPQHAFTKRHSVPLEALQGEPFVAFQAGLKIRDEIDRAFAARHVRPRIEHELDNVEVMKQVIVETGVGVSVLPQPTVAREIEFGTLVQIPIEGEPLARPLGIIHRRDRKLSETAQQFIDLLQSQATPTLAVSTNGVMTHDTNGHSTIVPEVRHIDTKDTPKRTSETGLTGSTGYEVVASTSR
jgi:DNA-binding transcriptional LysR family regulator